MIYEIRGALQTLKREGVGMLFRKIGVYARHLCGGMILFCKLRQEFTHVEESVDYAMRVAGGVIRPGQVRAEIVGLATLVRELQPKVVVEIGTAMGGRCSCGA